MQGRLDRDDRGSKAGVKGTLPSIQKILPKPIYRWVLHFEAKLEESVEEFSLTLPEHSLLLDAGAGEARFAALFERHRYVGVDLGVGDVAWDYSRIDAQADLARLPFRDASFDAAIHIVTLEHVPEPALVLRELGRVLRPGGRLFLVVPHEWEEHQQPHDYFRYTRYGLEYLLTQARMRVNRLEPVGGYFRLLSRRLFNGAQFFGGPGALLWLLLVSPVALVLPWLEGLDREKHFTLGYICEAQKL
ncbi:MAG TPA: class I SAM-dependent methyltransferase [Bryobacteraceae bacterium]|nr:class I SAM-dependent methyltransferase [Bryobacteraceae bacterium]